jgi:hypothetical protein
MKSGMEFDMETEHKVTNHSDREAQVSSYGIGQVEDAKVSILEGTFSMSVTY